MLRTTMRKRKLRIQLVLVAARRMKSLDEAGCEEGQWSIGGFEQEGNRNASTQKEIEHA